VGDDRETATVTCQRAPAFVFDLHDEAYYTWRAHGVRGAALVHVDAHHDVERMLPGQNITIGNFVRAALSEGILSSIFWVVPDPMWRDRRTRNWLVSELHEAGAARGRFAGTSYETNIDGVRVWTGTLDALPRCDAPALLDVDVDYLMTIARHPGTRHGILPVPWCWPAELEERLRARAVRWQLLTVATSITGAFIPLRWQHLGREIVMRLDPSAADPARIECFELLRESAAHRGENRLDYALRACDRAAQACPDEAAAHFHRAEILLASNDCEAARAAFRRAVELVWSYRHPFRTHGFSLLGRKRVRDAAEAFHSAFVLDPDDPYAELGLAQVALLQSRPDEAIARAERSRVSFESIEAWRTIARAAAALGDRERAHAAYFHAMRLALHGTVPVNGPWGANPERRLVDPDHWRDHAEAAALHHVAGDLDSARAHYQIAIAAPRWQPMAAFRLAVLHARRQEWSKAGRAAAAVIPRSVRWPFPWPAW
jgi:tetratricopeptide (TPR) repeat protein